MDQSCLALIKCPAFMVLFNFASLIAHFKERQLFICAKPFASIESSPAKELNEKKVLKNSNIK